MYTVHTLHRITVDISKELIKDYRQDLTGFRSLAHKLEEFSKLDATYLRNFLIRRNHQIQYGTIRMLEAHGNSTIENKFMYADLENEKLIWHPVNDWLDQYDGKYDILYLSVCNEQRIELPQRKSTIIYPLGRHNGESLIKEANGESISNLTIITSSP